MRQRLDPGLIFVAEDSSLAKWRRTLMAYLVLLLCGIGWWVALPSIMLAVSQQLWALAALAVFAPLCLTALCFYRHQNSVWLSLGLLLALYLLSVVAINTHGMLIIMYLITLPILEVLLLSMRVAVLVVLINAITLFSFGYFMKHDAGAAALSQNFLLHWLLMALNFLISNAALTWSCAFLLHGVDAVLMRQRQNVRALKENAQKLEHMAMHDTLTGLANRRLLNEQMTQVMARAKRHHTDAAVMLMDLDDFKSVNDSHGHALGDDLIKAVGQRLQQCVRTDEHVARLGGDEFVVLLTDLRSDNELRSAIQRILECVNGVYALTQTSLYVSASAGVSVYPRDGMDQQTLLKCADTAMYRAKDLGRNSYQFYRAEMNQRLLERLDLEQALRQAIEQDQLTLYYQPRLSATDGSCCSAEALIRWRHPKLGLVSPARFIPVAEDTGLIVPVGAWVLRTAAKQLLAWQQRYPRMRLSINVSAREFRDEALGDRIRDATPGLQSDSLELEITESMVMDDLQEAQQLLDRVREHGVCVAIDDFGTGLSCLAYLKALPLDVIKIDRSFVHEVDTNRQNHAIVKTIVDLANNLQLSTVAEGVETEAQAHVLRSLGVNELQGYHFAHPMPADAFEAWLSHHTALRSGV